MSAALVAFLRARLDHDYRVATLIPGNGCQPGRWTAHPFPGGEWAEIRQHEFYYLPGTAGAEGLDGEADVVTVALVQTGRGEHEHVTRWDPEHVCADIAAKRAVLDLWDRAHAQRAGSAVFAAMARTMDAVVAELARPYADHPDYAAALSPS